MPEERRVSSILINVDPRLAPYSIASAGGPPTSPAFAIATVISTVELDIAIALLGAVVAVLYRRWRGSTPSQRRAFAPVLAGGSLTFVLLMASLIVEQAGLSPNIDDAITLALFGSIACLPIAFVVGLHVATAVALIIYFRRDWVRILRGLVTSIARREVADPDQRLAWLLLLATIPVGIAGIAFSMTGQFKWKAVSSVVLGVALLLYGSDLITSAASDVEQANWFSNFLHSWNGSTWMAFSSSKKKPSRSTRSPTSSNSRC